MGRKRKPENRGLPQGWSYRNGAYYFKPKPSAQHLWQGKFLFRLGKTLSEAHFTYAQMISVSDGDINTVGQLLDRYTFEVIPTFTPNSQRAERAYVKALKMVFNDVPLQTITPQVVYKYADKRTAKTSAKNEVATLSNAFSRAVKWGVISEHPFIGQVTLRGFKKARDRYISDDEIKTLLSVPGHEVVKAYINLKLLIGCRKADMLRITMADFDAQELRVYNAKSNKPMAFRMTKALQEALEQCRMARPALSPYLFCSRKGECLVKPDGRTDQFDRMFVRLKSECKLKITEHDLRRKVASDQTTLDRASELLGHADTAVTKRHYRAKPVKIEPAK